MLETLYRRAVIPSFETLLKGRRTFRYLDELERTQWLSADELQSLQLSALRRLLERAYGSCPYFRDDWDERGLHPSAVRSLDDFASWPLVERDTIRENRSRLRTTQADVRLISKSTGGSSGTPLHFDLDTNSDDRRMAAWHRGYSWAGAGPGTRQLYLWGVPLVERTARQRWKDWLHAEWLYRRTVLNSFELSDTTTESFLRNYERSGATVVVAYVSALYEFARSLERLGRTPRSPKSIVVGAEKLHDFQRELIERVFGAPVFETYGSREFMLIGAECERHAGLHLTTEQLLVEILDDDGRPTPDGEEGNVVVTDLYNYGMPFVRYVTGDRAVAGFEACSCGRGLPLLRRVVGRQLDVVVTTDGRRIPGEFFPHLIKDFTAVRRFQVVQDQPECFDVSLVVDNEWSAASASELEDRIRSTVGETARFAVKIVDDIALTRAGKLQVVVNRCPDARTPVTL